MGWLAIPCLLHPKSKVAKCDDLFLELMLSLRRVHMVKLIMTEVEEVTHVWFTIIARVQKVLHQNRNGGDTSVLGALEKSFAALQIIKKQGFQFIVQHF